MSRKTIIKKVGFYGKIRQRANGGIGRRARLKIWFQQWSVGSIPTSPTKTT